MTLQFNWMRWELGAPIRPIRFQQCNMKHWMGPSTWIHFQLIGQITHLLHDFKRTNPLGHKLAASLRVLQHHIFGTQKHLIPNSVSLLDSLTVRRRLLSLLRSNRTCSTCTVSITLHLLNKRCGLRRAFIFVRFTQKSTRVSTKDQMERRITDRRVMI
jgi:hypothetical protein